MKQKFSPEIHEQFKKEFNIKASPSQIDMYFLEKTKKSLKYIKWIPGIKMIWLGNSVSMNAWTPDSDIDLFIVTSQNRLWTVRILITLIFQILWIRKTKSKHAWRFCLSFFSTLDWMDFSSWKIENDIYLYFWILYFKPILDYNNTYSLFIEKNSSWADFYIYNDVIENNKSYIKYKNILSSFSSKEERIQDRGFVIVLNNILKKFFLPKTIKTYNKIWKPYWIIINDNILKFHNLDIRKKIKKNLTNRVLKW